MRRAWAAGLAALAVAAGSAAGCTESTRAQGREAAAKAAAADKPLEALETAKRLALAPVKGSGPVDRMLRKRQGRVRRAPHKLDAWILLGYAWARKARAASDPGYLLHAKACADIGLKVAPGNRLSPNLHGMVLLSDHRFAEAVKLARKTLRRAPRDSLALGILSDALIELGRVDQARAVINRMVSTKPNLPSYARVSYLYFLKGQPELAKRAIRHAYDAGIGQRDREPATWVLVQAAQLFWHEGDYAGAEAGYDLALERMPGYPKALMGKARCRLSLGDARGALPLAKRAHAEHPSAASAWLLHDIHRTIGHHGKADEARAAVLRLGRHDKRTLALFLATQRLHPRRALALAQVEHRARPGVYTEDALAWALYRNGQLADARAASDRALAHGTRDARLWAHAGAIRIAQGQTAAGRALVAKALALSPQFDVIAAEEARKLLDATGGAAAAIQAAKAARAARSAERTAAAKRAAAKRAAAKRATAKRAAATAKTALAQVRR